jgi:hypothetical protein
VIRKRRRRSSTRGGGGGGGGDDSDNDDDDGDGDCGIMDHLWDFILYSPDYKPFDPLDAVFYGKKKEEDEKEKEPTGIRLARELDNGDVNDDCYRYNVRTIAPRAMLSEYLLPLGHVGFFNSDCSHTTKVHLKALSV